MNKIKLDLVKQQAKWASLINRLANIIIDVAPSQIDNPIRQKPIVLTVSSNDLDLVNNAIEMVLPYLD